MINRNREDGSSNRPVCDLVGFSFRFDSIRFDSLSFFFVMRKVDFFFFLFLQKLSLFRSRSPIVAGTPSGPVFSPAPPHPLSPPLAFASPVENPSPSQFRRRGPVVSGLEPCAPKIPAPALSPA